MPFTASCISHILCVIWWSVSHWKNKWERLSLWIKMGKSKFQGFHLWPEVCQLESFQRLKKNYGCLKWCFFWIGAVLKFKPVSHGCNSGPTEHSIYFFLFSDPFSLLLTVYFRLCQTSSPGCLSESLFLVTSSLWCSPQPSCFISWTHFSFFWLLYFRDFTALSLQEERTTGIFWGSRSTRHWQMMPCSPEG